jgi:hypothetical protein
LLGGFEAEQVGEEVSVMKRAFSDLDFNIKLETFLMFEM